jgi:hypothetical protein
MRSLDCSALGKVESCTHMALSGLEDAPEKHASDRLAQAVARVYFKEHLDSDFYLLDYDDTLFGRNGSFPRASRFNIRALLRLNRLTDVSICTGNSIRAIDLRTDGDSVEKGRNLKPLIVFADGGVNRYLYCGDSIAEDASRCVFSKCVSPDVLLATEGPHGIPQIVRGLCEAGIPKSTIDVRGNAVVSIKPVQSDTRSQWLAIARRIAVGAGLEVRECGKTTIEICNPALTKACALKYLYSTVPLLKRITYVGDELDSGNDRAIKEFSSINSGIICLHVNSPAKTAFFISTLLSNLEPNVCF